MVRELSLDAADAFHKMEADNRPLQVCRDNFGSEDYKSTQPSDANSSRISRLFWLGARESAHAAEAAVSWDRRPTTKSSGIDDVGSRAGSPVPTHFSARVSFHYARSQSCCTIEYGN